MHGTGILKVFLTLIVIGLMMDWYVVSGLKTFMKGWKSSSVRKLVRYSYLIISIGISLLFIMSVGSFRTARGTTPFREWMVSLFLATLVTKLFFVLVLFLGDLGRLFYGIVRVVRKPRNEATTPNKATTPFIPARRKFLSEAAILAGAVPFTAFLYAMVKGKYDYRLHKHTLYFEDLPAAFDGFTITQVSDIHSGSFDNTGAVQRGIDLAKRQNSDLFVFTGDLVNNAAWEIEPYLDMFSQLKAPYGQFSILGNHDYGEYVVWGSDAEKAANLEQVKAQHKALGYRLLLDENVVIEKDGQKVTLIGVQNWGRGFIQVGDLDKALQGVDKDAFKILLSHDPTHWEEKVRYHPTTIQLTLSGHTHGAQFGVETEAFKWSPVQYRYLDWAGLAEEKNRYLYVNRGFGFLAFSGRLGIWPEITVITLKKSVT
jgi:predicted MPP superfamily phosphohydrolase